MRKIVIKRIICFILTCLLFNNIFAIDAVFANRSVWPKCPAIMAKSAIVIDVATGTPLIQKNAEKKWYPASTTKIMTALLAIENAKNLDEKVTFTKEAIDATEPGSSSIGMTPGEVLTLRECLYGLMLASANEVANAIAVHIGGSIEEFAEMMNKRAKELGCVNTNFKNPSGLYEDDHYTCPADMAKIAGAAIKLEDFREIAGTRKFVIPETNLMDEKRYLSNTHQLFNPVKHPEYAYEYCYAGKTGYTNEARFNLVSYAKKGTMDVVCVVMNADSKDIQYTNTKKLLDYSFKHFRMLQTDKIKLNIEQNSGAVFAGIFENDSAAEFSVSGAALLAVPKKCDVNGVLPTIYVNEIENIEIGNNCIGNVEYRYNGNIIGSTELIYKSSKNYSLKQVSAAEAEVTEASEAEGQTEAPKHNYKAYILIGGAVLIILVMLWYVYVYMKPSNVARRRYRRSRRSIDRKNRFRW